MTIDVNGIVQLINGVGFPIAACIALFYQNWKERDAHKEEVDKLSTVIASNTEVMKNVLEHLEGGK